MKLQDRKSNEPTMMLLRLFRIADLLATVISDDFSTHRNFQSTTPKTQN
ncbi:MAG: hypothetical protein RLP44_27835 [Aggregatilineales bacterium]